MTNKSADLLAVYDELKESEADLKQCQDQLDKCRAGYEDCQTELTIMDEDYGEVLGKLPKCRQEMLRWKERANDHLSEWENCQEKLAAAEAREQKVLASLEGLGDGMEKEKAILRNADHATLDAALDAYLQQFIEHLDGLIPGIAKYYDDCFDPEKSREQCWDHICSAIQIWASDDAEQALG